MTNDKMDKSDQEFDQWLKASAGHPPSAPGDEWQNILVAVESAEPLAPAPAAHDQSGSSSLWSLTWPSLMAAAIPLAVALWGGEGLMSTYLGVPAPSTGTVQQTVADPALADDQVWLSAGDHQLDVVASGDVEPLVIDPAP